MKKLAFLLCLIVVSASGQLAMKRQSVGSKHVTAPAVGGGGPIALHSTNSASAASAGTTLTFALTLTNNLTDGYITVGATGWHATDGSTINSCTFDGAAMTALSANIPDSGGGDNRLFGLAVGAKASGAYNVVVTFSTTGYEAATGAASWNNVHQTTSVGSVASATAASTTPTVDVTSATGEVVLGHFWSNSDVLGGGTPGAGQTRIWYGAAGADVAASAGTQEAGTTTTTVSYSIGYSGWIVVAIPLKPANP